MAFKILRSIYMGKFTFNKISSAVLNLLCAALEVPAAITVLSKNGLSAFEFFTNDSNFFAFFARCETGQQNAVGRKTVIPLVLNYFKPAEHKVLGNLENVVHNNYNAHGVKHKKSRAISPLTALS